jgi:glycerol-3-phosphate acyltransferase PlsY
MEMLVMLGILILAYLIGSIPFGLVIVKIKTGQDVRQIESGRTGGTNAMRAAGFAAGLATAIFDLLKGAVVVWISRRILPGNPWIEILAPVAAILGHNYSIYMIERNSEGKLRLRGGAGGAPCVGGSMGLWAPSILVIIPIALLILYFIGYASLATISVSVISIFIFAYRAWLGLSPWQYVIYGMIAFWILVWALRPNIRRLIQGNERLIGYRARRKNKSISSNK